MDKTQLSATRSLTTPAIDFLLLGGASLLVWAIMISFRLFSSENTNNQFFYLAVLFSWLSIICNYPHFLISYRFGYGRGKGFVYKNWPALIAMPLFLIFIYIIAYYFFTEQIKSYAFVLWLNNVFRSVGMEFQLGALPNLGIEILNFSVRIMFITTGWHYAKQAFGCIMVFSHYHQYPLTKFQRNLWKLSLYSIAIYNFFYISNLTTMQSGTFSYFFDVPILNSIYPDYMTTICLAFVAILGFAVIYFILVKNYLMFKMLPNSSILIPWIALHFWWIPFLGHNDFYLLAVPFFHSLQYLLFAYQLEAPERTTSRSKKVVQLVLKTIVLITVGYLSFIFIPRFLDSTFSTQMRIHVVFFIVAISVFINVHHFFIDSVVWRFSDEHVRLKLLD